MDKESSLDGSFEREIQVQHRMLSMFFSKKIPHIPQEHERKFYPEKKANFVSRMFFWWLFPVMQTGYKRTLEPEDLFKLTEEIKIENMAKNFIDRFVTGVEKSKQKYHAKKCKERGETVDTTTVDLETDLEDYKLPKTVTILALFKTFQWQYISSCLFLVAANVGLTCNPLIAKKLIQYVEDKAMGIELGIGKGVGYSLGSSFMVFFIGLWFNHFFYRSMLTGAQAKSVLTKAILEKSFHLSAESKHKYPAGKITSMMGTDLARIDFALGFQPFLFTFPIPIGVAIAILVVNIGVSALVGIALLLIFMGAVAFLTKSLFAFRAKANSYTDSRVDHIKEALANLKIIKFYSWEPPYHENISNIRSEEMKIIYKMQLLRNIVTAFAMSLTLIASMVAFLVLYGVSNGKRNPANIFSSISLFNVLTQQLIMLPLALSSGADAFLGVTRVGDFLGSSELDEESVRIQATAEKQAEMEKSGIAIEVNDASFEWETFEEEEDDLKVKEKLDEEKAKAKIQATSDTTAIAEGVVEEIKIEEVSEVKSTAELESESDSSTMNEKFSGLNNIDFQIKKNEFVVITGLIGSGKSSLLNAISGFMKRTSGEICVDGSLLLCGYPWVQNATVKDNILFGEELDEEKYKQVVYACSLESDLDILPAGDKTEIGERGITLSGGQKARINLARAVYANKDIILLDDVLSAVDARVGKHIMENCIMGLLKSKTRILATHQLSLISSADRIIFLRGDGNIDIGTFDEMKEKNDAFQKLMAYNNEETEEEEEEEVLEDDFEEEKELIQRQLSKRSSTRDEEADHLNYNANNTDGGKLVESEERAVNGIDPIVYANYIKFGSGKFTPWGLVPLFLSTMILATFCQLFTNVWLSFWTEYKFKGKSDGFYIGFYVMFTMLSFALLTLEFVVLVYLTNTASVTLNILAIKKILHAPMSFMDTTPMGRILNRFTKDTDVLDNEVGDQLRFFCFVFSNIIGVLILCVVYLPWFGIAIPFLGFMFVAVSNYYQASAREIKRLEAVQRSFVYNNFNETLSGMATIKAYKADSKFGQKSDLMLNNMNEAYFITIANQRWLAIHMDFIAFIFVLLISLLCINRVFKISAASVGLLLSYIYQIAGQLSMLIRTFTQVENEMNSVERLSSYAFDLPEEAPYEIPETAPHPSWPDKGEIRFENASLAYRPGLPLVLKNINFDIKPAEKIGICGRTGAGKSSIMTALYRLSELQSGSIYVDGIDISTLGLKELRSKLSIIPQDPVLFRGSIRKNLDPFDQSPDELLWDSLRRTGLIDESKLETVKKQVKPAAGEDVNNNVLHKFHLQQTVEDEGSNFSLGERQLIAFARALVRDSKILILDEATSSVDYETDAKIQRTIIKEFKHCTILCIAHRLKTIINYDRIMVLDKGSAREFDTPHNLFKSKNSIFQQMCKKSNITEQDFENVNRF